MVNPVEDEWVEGSRRRPQQRAGSQTLSLFTYALNARLVRAHADGPLRMAEIESTIGWAPQTSLRTAVGKLTEAGILAPWEDPALEGVGHTQLTLEGSGLLEVVDELERWLQLAPAGPIELEGPGATGAIRAMVAGWDCLMVRKLAEREMSLTQLSSEITGFGYPTLERRLSRMRGNDLVTPVEGRGKGKPYAVTEWLRRATAPLAVAGRWERLHRELEAQPIDAADIEAAFLLALPLAELPATLNGSCSLVVVTPSIVDGAPVSCGVDLTIEAGRIVSLTPQPAESPQTWALGSAPEWFDAVIDGHLDAIRSDGPQADLPLHLARATNRALFP